MKAIPSDYTLVRTSVAQAEHSERRRRGFSTRRLSVCLLLALVVVLIVSGFLIYQDFREGAGARNLALASTAERGESDAGTILLYGGTSKDSSINPQNAELTDTAFKTMSITWQVRRATDNKVLYEGTGTEVDAPFSDLMRHGLSGDYMLAFFVSDSSYQLHTAAQYFSIA